jgi:hypothetical protein
MKPRKSGKQGYAAELVIPTRTPPLLTGALVFLVLLAAACGAGSGTGGSGPSPFYQRGYRFGQSAANGLGSPASVILNNWIQYGTQQACYMVRDTGAYINDYAPHGQPLPGDEMPLREGSNVQAESQWEAGCIAGYNHGK